MKTVAVVPMKLNNRRLPQKNTKPFTNGKPLCWYILSTLLQVRGVEEVYVYCSNPEIQEFLPEGVKYLRRGEDLDQDTTKMNEVLQRFAADVPADVYVMTHTTAPFVKRESIEKGLDAVLSGEYDSAFAVKELRDFLWKDGKPFNYQLDAIPRTQDLPPEDLESFAIDSHDVTTEDRTVLTAALSTLSDEERQIIMLHVTAGLKHREIAQLLELPLSTVLSKYRRALSKLKQKLEGGDAR